VILVDFTTVVRIQCLSPPPRPAPARLNA